MRVIISGRHLNVTTAIKEYARDKAGRLDRFHRGIQTARLTLTVEHGCDIAEIVVQTQRSTFVVHVEGKDMYAVIDKLMLKMERQLRRHKGRMRDRKTGRKGRKRQRDPQEVDEIYED